MVGTSFESSHIGLDKWLLAFYLLCASKKGMSAHQLHRMLGITYKSAWFLFHRIREAMAEDPFQVRMSGTVEVDETFIGGKPRLGQIKSKKEARMWSEGEAREALVVLALASFFAGGPARVVGGVTCALSRGGVLRQRFVGRGLRVLGRHVDFTHAVPPTRAPEGEP
jgi:hypothetical protein